MPSSGAIVVASVTVPEIRPPSVSEKFIPVVILPAVTAMGVPEVWLHVMQSMLLYISFM